MTIIKSLLQLFRRSPVRTVQCIASTKEDVQTKITVPVRDAIVGRIVRVEGEIYQIDRVLEASDDEQ